MKGSGKEIRLPIDEQLRIRLDFISERIGVITDTELARLSIYKTFLALGGNTLYLQSKASEGKKAFKLDTKGKKEEQQHG